MSLVIVETLYDEPLTFDRMSEEEERLVPCLTARQATWRYSLLSIDRYRTICTYNAPDAESVRIGYHRANVFFSRTWTGEMYEPPTAQSPQIEPQIEPRIVMEVTCPALSQDKWQEMKNNLLHCYSEQGIEWLRAYVSLDRTTLIWELNAPTVETVENAQRQSQIPFDRIWLAELLNPEIWAELASSRQSI
jgi:hypothetical protein